MFPYTIAYLYEEFGKIFRDYDHSSHDLRHTRLTDLSKSGMSLVELQNFAAHSDPKTTSKYITISKEDMLEKIRKIDANIESLGNSQLK